MPTRTQAAIALLLATSEVGAHVASELEANQADGLRGRDKFAQVLQSTVGALRALELGDFDAAALDDFARELVQTVFNRDRSASAAAVADAVLAAKP